EIPAHAGGVGGHGRPQSPGQLKGRDRGRGPGEVVGESLVEQAVERRAVGVHSGAQVEPGLVEGFVEFVIADGGGFVGDGGADEVGGHAVAEAVGQNGEHGGGPGAGGIREVEVEDRAEVGGGVPAERLGGVGAADGQRPPEEVVQVEAGDQERSPFAAGGGEGVGGGGGERLPDL